MHNFKQIFSNGNEAHVAKVLSRLGLEDCFDDIICFETLNPIHKDKDNVQPENDFDGESKRSTLTVLTLFSVLIA